MSKLLTPTKRPATIDYLNHDKQAKQTAASTPGGSTAKKCKPDTLGATYRQETQVLIGKWVPTDDFIVKYLKGVDPDHIQDAFVQSMRNATNKEISAFIGRVKVDFSAGHTTVGHALCLIQSNACTFAEVPLMRSDAMPPWIKRCASSEDGFGPKLVETIDVMYRSTCAYNQNISMDTWINLHKDTRALILADSKEDMDERAKVLIAENRAPVTGTPTAAEAAGLLATAAVEGGALQPSPATTGAARKLVLSDEHTAAIAALTTPKKACLAGGQQEWQVYLIRCLRNDFRYVGVTDDLPRRVKQHKAAPPPKMAADVAALKPFSKHFTVTVLADGISNEAEALRQERRYIGTHDATGPRGYNTLPCSPKLSKQAHTWWRKTKQ